MNDNCFPPSMGQFQIKNILLLDVLCPISATFALRDHIFYSVKTQVTWSRIFDMGSYTPNWEYFEEILVSSAKAS